MSNFIVEFKKGQVGKNKGLPMGKGLEAISKAIDGIQRGMMYVIASSPKVGKSTFVNYAFIISPYLYSLENPSVKIRWIYYSWEMDRVTMEFDYVCHFLYSDYGISRIDLPPGVTHEGKPYIDISSSFIRGQKKDDNNNIILVPEFLYEKIKIIYNERIVPLFGEYSESGVLIKRGLIDFIDRADNPTGIYKNILNFADARGTFIKEEYFSERTNKTESRIVGYKPNNPDEYVIVILDTIRKVRRERNFSLKETVDKTIEYATELRNFLKYTFVPIVHLNREMADIERLKFMGDLIFPQPETIKETGNLSEEATHIFTMFNPNDERYNLTKHFGLVIKDSKRNELYPNLRTIHLVESRYVPYPQHFRVNMNGALKDFKKFEE